VESAIQATLSVYPLSIPSQATVSRSLALYTRYSLSHWDCLLVAAAIEAGATTLYSEDLSHGITYDGLHVINPFRSDTP
jgi:predicted nucleic acid-binding protein